MKLIENNIEWLVAIALVFGCSFDVMRQGLNVIGATAIIRFLNILNYLILFCLYIYQGRHYKIGLKKSPYIFFFIWYFFMIFLYMTILRVYPLDKMASVPSSVIGFIVSFFRLLLYIMCAETIVKKFCLWKFMMLAVGVSILPSLLYIQVVGVEAIQMSEITKIDEEYLSGLTMGFACAPIFVCCLFYINKVFPSSLLSKIYCLLIITAIIYIYLSLGKRGPILWTLINIFICYYVIKKKHVGIFISIFILSFVFYQSKDIIFEKIAETNPKTANRIKKSIEEGDTDGRFDLDNPKGSTYLIGLSNFIENPVTGSYFRLKTNYSQFKGHYPHNIFIEILMTLGIFGFAFFMYLLIMAYQNCCKLFRGNRTSTNMMFMILFLSSFLMMQTSRSLLLRVDFWLPFYILCVMPKLLSTKKL